MLFDWASAGSLTRYVYDLNSSLIARGKISEIVSIMTRTNAEGYDVFAHSMGSFLVMEAMRDQVQQGTFNKIGRLNTIILASPDIDIDLFRAQHEQIDRKFDRFYVLVSRDDEALNVSIIISGGIPRVGASDITEIAELGAIAIDLSQISDSSSGTHTKFAGSPDIVKLIGIRLEQQHKPVQPQPTRNATW